MEMILSTPYSKMKTSENWLPMWHLLCQLFILSLVIWSKNEVNPLIENITINND